MNPDQNQDIPDSEEPSTPATEIVPAQPNIQVTTPPNGKDVFSRLAIIWEKIRKPAIVAFLILAMLGIASGIIYPWGLWAITGVTAFVVYVAGVSWLFAFVWNRVSKDKSSRKKVQVFIATAAIIVLPGLVILPTVAGVWGYFAEKAAKDNYKKCMIEHTHPDSPRLERWTSDEQLKKYDNYYSDCKKIKPEGFYFYP